jgi:hypothetical protein
VLGAGGLEELAGMAGGAGVEDCVVERVAAHFVGVVFGGDEAGVAEGGEVEEDVGQDDSDSAGDLLQCVELRPCRGEVHILAHGEEEEEEYLGVLSVVRLG